MKNKYVIFIIFIIFILTVSVKNMISAEDIMHYIQEIITDIINNI